MDRLRVVMVAAVGLGLGGEGVSAQCGGSATPSAPALLTGAPISDTAIFLAWLPVTDAQGGVRHYIVYRDGVAATTRTTTFFADNGLKKSTRYAYRVSAVDAQGCEGPMSAQVSIKTLSGSGRGDTTPPSTPTGLKTTSVTENRIALSWQASRDDESGIGSYRIYRDGSPVGTTTGTSFADASVQPFTTYTYEVSAVNRDGLQSALSSPVQVTTLDPTPPSVPAVLTATVVSASQIDLAWQSSTDPESGIASYRIYRDGAHVGTTSGPSFSDTGVQPQTTYSYEVSAVNGDGLESARSGPVSATTPAAPDTSPPGAPAGLQATVVSSSRVDLAWQAASDPESGIASYRVYRDGARVATPSGLSFQDTGLQPGTTYRYEVSAVNGEGLEGARSSVSATTPAATDTSPPGAPAGLEATVVGPRRIDLTWQAASDAQSGISGYNLYRDGSLVTSGTGTSYTDSEVEPGTTYAYRVSAVNGAGLEGSRSPSVSATTPAEADVTPPAPPTGMRIVP